MLYVSGHLAHRVLIVCKHIRIYSEFIGKPRCAVLAFCCGDRPNADSKNLVCVFDVPYELLGLAHLERRRPAAVQLAVIRAIYEDLILAAL
jgi:hypothetical protein